MREKKFRAWDKATETYLYSDTFPSMWQFYKELENRGIRHFETEDYTGLKDKNGKEIYEEDIIKDYYGKVMRIDWADCWARYMLSYDGEWCQYYLEDYHNNKVDHLAKSMEVIGNIRESPELLNGG